MLIIDYVLLIVLSISCYTDLRFQKIYNALLFPSAFFALSFHFGTGGLDGVLYSLKGAGLGLVLFLLPYLLGGIGAGDVKLLAVVGAYKGAGFVFCSFFFTAILGGLISLLILFYRGEMLKTLRQLGQVVKIAFLSRLTVWNLPRLDDENRASLPYGVAIALGSVLTFVVM